MVDSSSDKMFLVLELANGGDLQQRMHDFGDLPEPISRFLFIQLVSPWITLLAAHRPLSTAISTPPIYCWWTLAGLPESRWGLRQPRLSTWRVIIFFLLFVFHMTCFPVCIIWHGVVGCDALRCNGRDFSGGRLPISDSRNSCCDPRRWRPTAEPTCIFPRYWDANWTTATSSRTQPQPTFRALASSRITCCWVDIRRAPARTTLAAQRQSNVSIDCHCCQFSGPLHCGWRRVFLFFFSLSPFVWPCFFFCLLCPAVVW